MLSIFEHTFNVEFYRFGNVCTGFLYSLSEGMTAG